jgi:hypothetical protein
MVVLHQIKVEKPWLNPENDISDKGLPLGDYRPENRLRKRTRKRNPLSSAAGEKCFFSIMGYPEDIICFIP